MYSYSVMEDSSVFVWANSSKSGTPIFYQPLSPDGQKWSIEEATEWAENKILQFSPNKPKPKPVVIVNNMSDATEEIIES